MRSAFLLALIPILAWGSPAEEPEEENIPILETTQELLGYKVNTVANRLDLFFADQRADDELGRSKLRLRYNYEVIENSLPKKDYQIRLNIRLPSLEEKFKFESENRKKKKKPGSDNAGKDDDSPNKVDTNWLFRSDAGVSVAYPPKVFARGRARKSFETGDVVHRFVEELSWYSDRDWEDRTTFNSDLTLSDDWLLRFGNSRFWRMTRKDFTTGHGPSLYHQFNDDLGISYSANFSTVVDDGIWYVTAYQVNANLRRNLYKQWLYFDIQPGLTFPKEESWRRVPFIFTQIEALFGGY